MNTIVQRSSTSRRSSTPTIRNSSCKSSMSELSENAISPLSSHSDWFPSNTGSY